MAVLVIGGAGYMGSNRKIVATAWNWMERRREIALR